MAEHDDLRTQYRDLSNRMGQLEQQQQHLQAERRRRQLTLNDLADVPSTVVSYRTLGKMFVREPLDTIRDNYGQKLETYGKELEGIEGMMRRTSDQLRQVEAQIKESSK